MTHTILFEDHGAGEAGGVLVSEADGGGWVDGVADKENGVRGVSAPGWAGV
jgi:hypothetical protein